MRYIEDVDDYRLWYGDGYVFDKGLKCVIKIEGFHQNGNNEIAFNGKAYNSPQAIGTIVNDIVWNDQIDASYPELGWTDTKSGSFYVVRRNVLGSPEKYKRCLLEVTVDIQPLLSTADFVNYIGWPRQQASTKTILVSLFFKKPFDLEKGYLSIVQGKRLSASLSKDFCIAANFKKDGVALYFGTVKVGSVLPDLKIKLYPENSYLIESITEYLGVDVCF